VTSGDDERLIATPKPAEPDAIEAISGYPREPHARVQQRTVRDDLVRIALDDGRQYMAEQVDRGLAPEPLVVLFEEGTLPLGAELQSVGFLERV
jgi:hypothetical protein